MKLHTLICDCCKNYTPDSKVINDVLGILNNEATVSSLTKNEKEELKDLLKGIED